MKYVALARVSSREQEREGFSLDVQEEALKRYAQRQGGEIVQLYRIAETASRKDERKTFRELLAYAKQERSRIAGVLFYKVDRAARNLFDYVELERLEVDHGIPVVYVAQPTENTPAGRMQRRILANMASFYTEQQSLDVREGMQRRVEAGWFVGKAPFGYRNVRIDGRGIIEVDAGQAEVVREAFMRYSGGTHTLDTLLHMLKEQFVGVRGMQRLSRSGLHRILNDRAYLGEVPHHDAWRAGKHTPLITPQLWEAVQTRLGGKVHRPQQLTWSGQLIRCADCGRPVTGERVRKATRNGETFHTYYRCTRYTSAGHTRWRMKEQQLDAQIHGLLASLKVPDPAIADWFRQVIQARAKARTSEHAATLEHTQQRLATLTRQTERLLEMRMNDEIDADTFRKKQADLNTAIHRLQQATKPVQGAPAANLAAKALEAFELSQTFADTLLSATPLQKRRLTEKVAFELTLDATTLSATMRKPFDVLAEGLKSKNGRGERI